MGTMTADKKPDGESVGRESIKPESMKKTTDIGPTSIDGSGSGFGKRWSRREPTGRPIVIGRPGAGSSADGA